MQNKHALLNIAVLLIGSIILISVLYAALKLLNINKDLTVWILALLTIVFGVGITLLISRAIKEYIIVNGVKQEAGTISLLFEIIAYSLIAIVALYLVHVNVTGLLVSAGFLGIVLGLAAQATLGNVFSGISMILAKPLEPGDYVTLQTWQYNKMPSTYPHEEYIPGYSGTVRKIGLLYTELIDDYNEPLYVPNGILNQALVINHRRAEMHVIRFRAELDRSVPFDNVKKRITEILKKHNADKRSYIAMEHLSENTYSVSVTINTEKTKVPAWRIKSEILKEILKVSTAYSNKSKR